MIRIFFLLPIIALMMVFGGCATTTQGAQVQYVQACGAYASAFSIAVELHRQGKLNQAQINALNQIDAQITPICTGPLPTDPVALTQQVTAAVTTLTVMGAIQATTKGTTK